MATDKERTFDSAKKAFTETASGFTEQASAKARDYAVQGKDRTVEALDNVASLVTDAAGQVSEKLGDQYGGYIRRAADAVSGFATTLRNKDAEELIGDARDAVRSSPAIAIAAATAVGFLIARVVKSGFTAKDSDAAPRPKPARKATPAPAAKKAAPAAKKAAPRPAAPKPAAKAAVARNASVAKPAVKKASVAKKAVAPKKPAAGTPPTA